jgi:chemotaxis-related protein WspD
MNSPDASGADDGGLVSDPRHAILRLLDRPLGPKDVQQATERVAQPLVPPDRDLASLLLMRLGPEFLALPSIDILRVARTVPVRRIPHRTNAVVLGLCNLDGELLLCGGLPTLLDVPRDTSPAGEEENEDSPHRLVVIGSESGRWAVEVDEVLGVRSIESASCLPPPATLQGAVGQYTKAIFPMSDIMTKEDQEVVAILDASTLVSGFEAALR